MAPRDAGADRTTGGVHQARRALVHHDQAGLPPGVGGELRGRPVTRASSIRCSRAAPVSASVQHREADAVGAGREVEAVEARGAEEAAVDERGGGADRRPATGRRRPRGAAALRSRCAIAGPVTRNDTGAWSIRGPSSSPASAQQPGVHGGQHRVAPDQRGDVGIPGRPHQRDLRRGDGQRLGGVHPGVVRRAGPRGRWRPARPGAARRPPSRRSAYGARPARASASAAGSVAPSSVERLAAAGEQAAEVGQRDDLAGGAVAGRGHAPAGTSASSRATRAVASAGEMPVSGSSRVRSRVATTARVVRRSSHGAVPTARASIRSPW